MGGVFVSAESGKEIKSKESKKLDLKEFTLTRNPGFRRERINIS